MSGIVQPVDVNGDGVAIVIVGAQSMQIGPPQTSGVDQTQGPLGVAVPTDGPVTIFVQTTNTIDIKS